jgi:hypothetical protein
LSASDKKIQRRAALRYVLISLFCGFFAAVYEHFSHGVYSNYMICLFVWPLLGALPCLLLRVFPPLLSRNLWGAGVATLTVGSCLKGVFEIYGTTAPLVLVYWYAGAALLAASAAAFFTRPRAASPDRANP